MARKGRKKETSRELLFRGQQLVDANNAEADVLLQRALALATAPSEKGACQDALGILRRRTGDNDAAMTFFRAAIESHHGSSPDGEARSLVHLSGVEIETGLLEDAIDHLRSAWTIANAHGDATLQAHVADVLSYALEAHGDHEEAAAIGARGLALLEGGDRGGQLGISLGNKGAQLQIAGKSSEAEHQYKRAIVASERAGDLHNLANVLCNLGSLCVARGRFTEAAPWIERGMAVHEKIGNQTGAAHAALLMADLRSAAGDSLEAIALQREAIAKFHTAGNRYFEGIALGNMGNEEMTLGRLDQALAHHREAIDLLRMMKQEKSEGCVLTNQALVFAETDRIEDALEAAKRAADIFHRAEDVRWLGIALLSWGLIEHLRDRAAARRLYESSLELLVRTDDPSQTARVLLCLAAIDIREGRNPSLDRAIGLAETAGDREAVNLANALRNSREKPGRLGVTGRLLWRTLSP